MPTHGHFIKLYREQVSFKKEAGVRVNKVVIVLKCRKCSDMFG